MRHGSSLLGCLILVLAAGCGGSESTFPDAAVDQQTGGDVKLPPGDGLPDGTVKPGDGPKTGDGPCLNKCTKGISQCVGAQLQTCNTQTNGCTDWDPPKDCSGGKACNAGACPTCTDDCTYNNTQCSGTKVQKCTKLKPDGCYTYNAAEDCPGGAACAAGKCPTCSDQCPAGNTQCAGTQVQTCSKQASSGCTDWDAPSNCAGGVACTGGKCPTCSNKCPPSSSQCVGTQIQHCKAGTDGCYDWAPVESCPNGKACVSDTCPTCSDVCPINTTKCSGAQIQTCELKPTGCTDWSAPAACPNGACANDKCPGGSCPPGDLRCTGNVLEQCNASGQWQSQQICAQSCDPTKKQCVVSVTCTAGTRRCNGTQVQICNATGTAWLTSETCNVSCQGGLCTGACTPGSKRCNGPTPETCNTTGNAWTTGTACTTFCYKGDCAQPSLTVDANANKQLDGELVYAGDVLIKNSSTVTVPTGKLIIRAKKVILDATSSITVAATGDDPRGKGQDGGSTSCNASGYCTASGSIGASGGGYSASGGGSSQQLSCYYYGTRYCTATKAGGALYGIADDEAAAGASGGSCSGTSGGKGGGLIAIYAEEILIQGAITANGQSGSGCAGGGSGGGIVLRATVSLTFSGSASVSGGVGGSGGAGAGALGVIKLLYGNAKSIAGTTTGKVFSSYMPPDDLSSSTHPSPSRWYNDGFSVFEVAWSKPFTQSGGYYYVENQSYAFVPSPSNALYQTPETLQYQASAFNAGANYVHLSVVGPAFDPSTIESRYLVQVNTTAPTVSSQSHPTPTTWYANNTPFLQWSLPKTDENTSRFYWVLDRFSDTIPDKSANAIPMNLLDPASSKRILLPVTGNGIWFFHVIAEDTMGYLTKAGATFRIQIGADPGKGGVSGTITDGSTGSFLSGVSVTLNRGVHTATTNATGAYAFTNNTVFAQDYEVRASKTGYKTGVQTVTVTSGQTATVNLALQPE